MELWAPITLAAAFMQNLRSALQKHLKGSLSTSGATFCRFVYAVPLALAYVALLGEGLGFEWPTPNPRFALFAMLGGVTQITATALLVYLVLHVADVVDYEGKVPSLPEAAVFAAREPLMLRGGPAADPAFRPCRIGSILQAPTHTNHGWRLSVALGIGRR